MHKPLSKTELKRIKERITESRPENLSIIFLLQDVTDPINLGSIFRTADAIGVEKMILCGKTAKPSHPQSTMTSRGLERKVDWERAEEATEEIEKLKNDGYQIIALELTEDSVLYSDFDFSDKVVLVLGNEAIGVYKKILAMCDTAVHIPMFGKGPSLNVNVATAVVGFEIVSKKIAKK